MSVNSVKSSNLLSNVKVRQDEQKPVVTKPSHEPEQSKSVDAKKAAFISGAVLLAGLGFFVIRRRLMGNPKNFSFNNGRFVNKNGIGFNGCLEKQTKNGNKLSLTFKNGKIEKAVKSNESGIISTKQYKYNSEGELIKVENIDNNGKAENIFEKIIDEEKGYILTKTKNGHLLKDITSGKLLEVDNKNKRTFERFIYSKDGKLKYKFIDGKDCAIYEYDANGKVTGCCYQGLSNYYSVLDENGNEIYGTVVEYKTKVLPSGYKKIKYYDKFCRGEKELTNGCSIKVEDMYFDLTNPGVNVKESHVKNFLVENLDDGYNMFIDDVSVKEKGRFGHVLFEGINKKKDLGRMIFNVEPKGKCREITCSKQNSKPTKILYDMNTGKLDVIEQGDIEIKEIENILNLCKGMLKKVKEVHSDCQRNLAKAREMGKYTRPDHKYPLKNSQAYFLPE